jgi:hypothetical protein
MSTPTASRLPYIFLQSSIVSHSSLSSSIFFTLSSPVLIGGDRTRHIGGRWERARPARAHAGGDVVAGDAKAQRGVGPVGAAGGAEGRTRPGGQLWPAQARRLRCPAACGQGRSSGPRSKVKILMNFFLVFCVVNQSCL